MDAWLKWLRYDAWRDDFVHGGLRLITALVILLLGLWLARRLASLVRRTIQKRGGDAVLATFLRNAVYTGLSVLVVVGALDRAGVPTASLLAALGAAGLAIGLALKDSLGNLAAGVLLVVTRPFHAGDYVEIGGQGGTVQRIDLLQTILVTNDNRVIVVPNGQVMNQPIVNFSARGTRRLELPFVLVHDSDTAKAMKIARDIIDADPRVLTTPPAQIVITRLSELGVEMTARPWATTTDFWDLHSALLDRIRSGLDEGGVKLAVAARGARAADEAR